MRARQLEVFTAVMRAGTVTEAARMLNISQPALSQVLRHTEDELGFALFDREKGRLKPTPEALELYPEAERLFGELEGLRRMTADLRQGRAGLVRIGCSTPPAMSLLPRVMAAFRTRHPDIALRCNVAPVQSLRTMLREGDTALALALTDRMPEDIEVEVLGRTGFCCLLPKGHSLAAREAIALGDLGEEFVISYRSATRPFDELDKAARRLGHRFEPRLEIDTSISAVGFVQAGLGIAVVDSLLPWEQFDGIEIRPLDGAPALPLSLLTLRGKSLSRAEDLMREQIRALLPEGLSSP
ncbi:transcriptional regulator (plasmid) [Salipiger sp. CCB-MM3]|uniref:LysR family transcriptional regulator n=1 Tax=Salipiger sp. CCB-MM3 TaxID=1792508 RepID=UPI00080AB4C4|nr:LysR family transcriptional regulator [Salipiger sp. CCB-MM3]ANT63782.1 transcriptional regulator [Salipiger sp. CCB-MM3]